MTDQVHGKAAPEQQQTQTPLAGAPNFAAANENECAPRGGDVANGTRPQFARLAVGLWADPAPVITLTFIFGRIALATGTGVPKALLSLLAEHLLRGDLACRLVADWLTRTGVVDHDWFAMVSEADTVAFVRRRLIEDSTNAGPPVRSECSTNERPALRAIRGGRADD